MGKSVHSELQYDLVCLQGRSSPLTEALQAARAFAASHLLSFTCVAGMLTSFCVQVPQCSLNCMQKQHASVVMSSVVGRTGSVP